MKWIQPCMLAVAASVVSADPFASIRTSGTRLNMVSDCDDCVELVTLPFDFMWLGEYPITKVGVSSNGHIFVDKDNNPRSGYGISLSGCCGAEPMANQADPGIYIASEDLNPSSSAVPYSDVFIKIQSRSFIISYESTPFWFTSSSINAQVEVFSDGQMEFRYGTGTLPAGRSVAAGYVDKTVTPPVIVPLTEGPWGPNGVISKSAGGSWPAGTSEKPSQDYFCTGVKIFAGDTVCRAGEWNGMHACAVAFEDIGRSCTQRCARSGRVCIGRHSDGPRGSRESRCSHFLNNDFAEPCWQRGDVDGDDVCICGAAPQATDNTACAAFSADLTDDDVICGADATHCAIAFNDIPDGDSCTTICQAKGMNCAGRYSDGPRGPRRCEYFAQNRRAEECSATGDADDVCVCEMPPGGSGGGSSL